MTGGIQAGPALLDAADYGQMGRRAAHDQWDRERMEADADLIAAAPELLQILLNLGSEYPDGQPCFCEMAVGNPMVSSHSALCRAARDVIEKAR